MKKRILSIILALCLSLIHISGPTGQKGADGANGKTPEFRVSENTLQWRYVGDEIWLNPVSYTHLAGQPRLTQLERFRQRFMHKLVYFPTNNDGMFSCVGCGRCLAKCPIQMNIVKVMKKLGGNTNG